MFGCVGMMRASLEPRRVPRPSRARVISPNIQFPNENQGEMMNTCLKFFLALLLVSCEIGAAAAQDLEKDVVGVVSAITGGDKKNLGSTITFLGLSEKKVSVTWPDGYSATLEKLHEDQNIVVLQRLAPVGSTETVYIEKKSRRFLAISVGVLRVSLPNGHVGLTTYEGYLK